MNLIKTNLNSMKTSLLTLVINIILSAFKLIAGIVANSGAMISDAVHSASDVFSTIVVMIGLKLASKESDSDHPYGHERLECIAAACLSLVLAVTGILIAYNAVAKLITNDYDSLPMPGTLALIAAAVSILVKEWMFQFTKHVAKKENSTSLMADAWHHRSDSLSSVGSFVGICGAMLGFKALDPLAGFVIAIMIIRAGYDILLKTIDQMIDKSCDQKTYLYLENVIINTQGVMRIDSLKTRMFGSKIYVDVEISADGELSLAEAHKIAENVHLKIEDCLDEIKHCMVHVNPYE